jgi:hypothetical protein
VYCTVLYCTVLYCTVLYCTVLYCTVLCCAVLCCAVLCCAVLYCIVLYCTVLCCAVLCCAVLCCAVLYCTLLYCTVLYCTVLYCTVLYAVCKSTHRKAYSTHHHNARNKQCKNPYLSWSGPGFTPQNSIHHQRDMKQGPYCGSKIITFHGAKFTNWRPGFGLLWSQSLFASGYPTRTSYLNMIFWAQYYLHEIHLM